MKILFITLSNIGDVILTLPALDFLRENFPGAKITCLTGPRSKEIFENNPYINHLIIYNKRAPLKEKIRLFRELKGEDFEAVIDLRNSLFGILLKARFKTPFFLRIPQKIKHMKERHLYKAQSVRRKTQNQKSSLGKITSSLYISPKVEEFINNTLKENNIQQKDKVIVIAPGARSHIKRWAKENFLDLISLLAKEFKVKIILIGDKDDIGINQFIVRNLKIPVLDLSARTKLTELACLLKQADLVITNDSAVLHLASYLNRQVVALFGPTNENKYGPWSEKEKTVVVKKEIFCRPCEKAQCRFGDLKCMQLIRVEDVLRAVRAVFSNHDQRPMTNDKYKRILIVRTDRIGDVLLSTPVIKALRDNYPYAYIAIMVSAYAKDIVNGNPYLDEVIIYDKEVKHKSWFRSMRFSRNLKKKRFDLAIILHPTNRVHLVTFFAGIPRRVGYNRKFGFLLTDRLIHTKQLGEKHELEYNLDLLRYLGIESEDRNLFMPIKPESEEWVKVLFNQQGIKSTDKLLAIHPGASCPSKIWPFVRFAQVADRLTKIYGFKVLVVAGPKDISLAQNLIKHIQKETEAINLAGVTSVSQLASLLKRCQLFISNDSGPVHIASAVGTPVISIFGRNQQGLSPIRWGPVGKKDKVLHKEVGCIKCLAHNCQKEFACLKAITVEDVLKVADEILKKF
jgi:heptosyltransferase-2